MAPEVLGHSPYELEAFHRRTHMVPFFHGYLGYAAIAAYDVACWDLIGKATDRPLVDLLGGRFRDTVPITALITRADGGDASPAQLPEAIARHAAKVVEAGGFTAVKLKGTADVRGDVRILQALREALPATALRVDPNAAWSVQDTVSAAAAIEALDLEYWRTRVRASKAWPPCTSGYGFRCVPTCAWCGSRTSRPPYGPGRGHHPR